MPLHPSTLVAPLLAVALAAQERPLSAKSFLPDNHETIMVVDLEAFRERGVWEEIESSVLRVALPKLEAQLGFPIDSLDRMYTHAAFGGDDGRPQNLYLFEGNAPLKLSLEMMPGNTMSEEKIGEHDVLLEDHFFGEFVHTLATPALLVRGDRRLVEPVLVGEARNSGVPSPSVLSLLSGRGENLAFFVIHLQDQQVRELLLDRFLPDVEWPEGDEPTHLMMRARTIGDEDDPHLEVELVLRHAKGDEGLAVSEEAAREWFQTLAEDKQLGAVKSLWKSIELERSGQDLIARKDLGRLRQAIGTFAVLLAPMMPR